MQVNLLEVTIGAEFFLFAGYLLYLVLRKQASKEIQYSISFYVTILIGFITCVLIINSTLSLHRFLPSDIPILFSLLALDIILLLIIIGDTYRLKRSQTMVNEDRVN